MLSEHLLYANGVNGSTGRYALEPLTLDTVAELARETAPRAGDPHQFELRRRHERGAQPTEALVPGRDPRDLSQAGWGVIFPQGDSAAVYEALRPLLELRRSQAGRTKAHYYREYRGDDGVLPGESKQQFLPRHGVALGMPADPEFMPYYLMIVGDPEDISFRFQYELDVEYAVGRVWFPTADDYARYAAGVVAAETAVPGPRRAFFFGARSEGDVATSLSSEQLVVPLAAALRQGWPAWEVNSAVAGEATRERLAGALGAAPPALLFTASHGMFFNPDDPRQPEDQGALLCSDWPGPSHVGRIPERFYFAARDVSPDARLSGLIAFHFACFSGGTPALEDFPHEQRLTDGRALAPHPFVSALPRHLLAHPRGGALAVVGHVERAWAYSFLGDDSRPQLQVFHVALGQLLDGYPVGAALEWFNQRYASLATALTGELNTLLHRRQLGEADLLRTASLWTDHNDARSYVVLGDPAVRLRVGDPPPAPSSTPPFTEPVTTMPAATVSPPPLDPRLLDATEKRMQNLFGPPPTARAFALAAEADPRQRQDALLAALAKRPAAERLRANPPENIARRLRRIGVPLPAADRAARERADLSFALLEARGTVPALGLERIIGRNELLGVQYLDGGRLAARAVGRVVIRGSGGQTVGYGTGSLVSPRLLLTNNHVLESAQRATASVIQFNYQNGLDGHPRTSVSFALDPQTFFLTSPQEELDFTLVAVRPAAEGGDGELAGYGFNPLTAVADEILDGESVTIIQHPGGEPKQIALRENHVLKLPHTAEQFLYYQTDTTPGSSGAPVFNDQWEVVALHHSGFAARDAQGNYLTSDGQVWTPDMGEQRINWIANEGIRVAALIDFLSRASGLSAAQGRLRDEVIKPPPVPRDGDEARRVPSVPGPLTTTPSTGLGASPPAVLQPVAAAPVPVTAFQVVFTIPLQVTVSLGVPVVSPAAVSSPAPPTSGVLPGQGGDTGPGAGGGAG